MHKVIIKNFKGLFIIKNFKGFHCFVLGIFKEQSTLPDPKQFALVLIAGGFRRKIMLFLVANLWGDVEEPFWTVKLLVSLIQRLCCGCCYQIQNWHLERKIGQDCVYLKFGENKKIGKPRAILLLFRTVSCFCTFSVRPIRGQFTTH